MKHILLLFTALLAFSCRSASPDLADRAVALSVEYTPFVTGVLDTQSDHKKISVGISYSLGEGEMGAVNEERDTLAVSPQLESMPPVALAWIVVHELTHVHLTGYWDTLPHWLEEGVCESLAAQRFPDQARMITKLQPPMYQAGYRYVQTHGMENIRKLCIKAHSRGLERVPDSWLPNGWSE